MATIERYVVKISHSSIPFTAKSLNMDGSDDPFARYQVNELYICSPGKGKTLLLNVDRVARDFMVPSPYLVAYLGYSLGVKPNYDSKKPEKTRAFLSSSVDAEKLSQKMVNFMKEFVLCPKCKLPEITHTIDRKVGVVWADCRSCDAHVTLQLQDKFQRYINNHPLPFPGAKEENAVRKKQEAAENAALSVERKKLCDNEQEEEDDTWSADTSSDAVRARREILPLKLMLLSEVNSPSVPDFTTEFRSHLNLFERGSVPSVEIEQLFKTAQRLKQEFGLESTTFLEKLTQALFDTPSPLVLSKSKVALLKKAINSSSSSSSKQQEREQRQQQMVLLRTVEGIAGSNPEVMKKILSLLKICYDNDLLEEEIILKWYNEGTATGVRASIKKLVEWLQSAEEEE